MKAVNDISFGLTERDINTISGILNKYPEIKKVYIFGSRAKGTQKAGSDIDLAVMNGGVTEKLIQLIKAELDDSTLPYTVDLVNYPTLSHPDLKEHIVRVGEVFYEVSE